MKYRFDLNKPNGSGKFQVFKLGLKSIPGLNKQISRKLNCQILKNFSYRFTTLTSYNNG